MKFRRIISSLAIGLLLATYIPMAAIAADSTTPTDTSTTSSTPADSTQTTTPTTTDASTTPTTTTPTTTTTDPSSPTPTQTTGADPAPVSPTTGPSQPTGKAPAYAFNDATHKWEPTIISCFTWDASTGLWQCPAFYWYDSVVGWYHVKQNTPSASINSLTAGSADPAATLASILGAGDPFNSNTGPNSLNNSTLNTNNNLLATLINNLNVSNFDASTATSGDASVGGNTTGGSATTGAATVVKNLLNLLNAMWAWTGGGLSSFVQNIFGSHTGDVNLVSPTTSGGGGSVGALPSCSGGVDGNDTTGPNSTNNATTNCNNNLTVNSQTNGNITNNEALLAKSGNANVGGNTNGGDANSGDATAELNILNLINSAIGSGQSFFGVVNIYGDLNGDILFPDLGLNGTVASQNPGGATVGNSNTGPSSTNNATANQTNNANVNNTTNGGFNNNINATAQSGAANVSGNTSAGSATTGDAKTNTSEFNLFNTSIFGDNAVLVIINDMGHWVGQIMNLGGGGSGGALLTSNATVTNNNTGPSSSNTATSNQNNTANINNSTNGTINNNVRVGAVSGDANVSGNTIGGNAKSGNATVAANIANIFGSHLSFNKVFGILLINIMPGAHWFGSVGVNTAAGNAPQVVTIASGQGAMPQNTQTSSGNAAAGSGTTSNVSSGNTTVSIANDPNSAALAQLKTEQAKAASSSWPEAAAFLAAAGVLMLAAGLFSLDRRLNRR